MVHLGNLVAGVHLGCPVQLLVLLFDVVLLQELGAFDLVCLEELQISLCKVIPLAFRCTLCFCRSN